MADSKIVISDPWTHLKAYTRARIALGRTGVSLPTDEILQFGYAHAKARDAVHAPLDASWLGEQVQRLGFEMVRAQSAAPDRATYLLRPDLGRRLSEESARRLQEYQGKGFDVALVVGDGLSSLAVSRHAPAVLESLRLAFPAEWRISPVVITTQARVALSDEVGALLQAKVVVMLVGERPGLTSPDSLGIYLTYAPEVGRQDAERNCISNVRPEGLSYLNAARKTVWLLKEALRLKLSGVGLKDESDVAVIATSTTPALADRR